MESFARCLKNPFEAEIPYSYVVFLLMDILHKTKEEIEEMGQLELLEAVNYCWTTYFRRDVYYIMSKAFGIEKDEEEATAEFEGYDDTDPSYNEDEEEEIENVL